MRKMEGAEFDQLVDFFDQMVLTKWLTPVHEKIKELTGSWEELAVVDVGCGTGRLLLRGIEEAKKVVGIDISAEMIKACLENCKEYMDKSTFDVGDACNLPYGDNVFDLSLSTCVLFLLPKPEDGLKEMVRVTKNGGRIVLLNPAAKLDHEQALKFIEKNKLTGFEEKSLLQWAKVSTKRHRYDEDKMVEMLKVNGLVEIENYELLEGLALITVAKKA